MKTALITGITGQDGSYLAELLLQKGYNVHGIIRRSSSFNTGRIDHIYKDLTLHYGDMTDGMSLDAIISKVNPDEIYNLAAQSHVKVSFELPEYTANTDGLGSMRLLELIRDTDIKLYQASTSELYGMSKAPQDEKTPFNPCSPYGCAKLYAYWMTQNYRMAYGIHASNGILFNHESPRRGETFVTRKITKAAAEFYHTGRCDLVLGNLNAIRDWGHAKDYVEAMWLILQQDIPDDYVIATGVGYTVKDFAKAAFKLVGVDYKNIIQFNPKYMRPYEVPELIGNPKKAIDTLGWKPKYDFNMLVEEMVKHDIQSYK